MSKSTKTKKFKDWENDEVEDNFLKKSVKKNKSKSKNSSFPKKNRDFGENYEDFEDE